RLSGTEHLEPAIGPQLFESWRGLSALLLADVGLFPESRLLSVYQRLYDSDGDERRDGLRPGKLPAGPAGGEAASGRHSGHGPAPVVWRRLHRRRLAGERSDDAQPRRALRIHERALRRALLQTGIEPRLYERRARDFHRRR